MTTWNACWQNAAGVQRQSEMTDFLDRISKLSPKRLALLALEQHEQLQALQDKRRDPIAIVGMGCRYPGGAITPDAYWQLLREGRDAIREVPAERWNIDEWYDADPDAPARMSARAGGFLDEVSGFDPAFFGISPREALTMDPQQRLLLEVAWEALENAGISPASLHGTQSGVFVGICNSDHFNRLLQRGPESIDAYVASGSAHSVAAGRIAYFLGLQGPALSIDTACSSSLVALHAACASLRNGEAGLALAAGVNVMCSPETTIALSKAHMLAPDGRCKTFDAAADGFSRGEGCGVLVLKRLSDALADGDPVLAVIRGSAVNQDGHSGGLTVPNGPAQEAVIRAALADAGVKASDIDYVEAHGTGTSLGDPIEVRALSNALGAGRSGDRRLWIGSVKTNIGHLESAAGIAGVMKVVLSLVHQRIPPHLHFSTPGPHIPWDQFPVEVTSGGHAWLQDPQRARRAGVSSFGFSGTNAHVVIEEAPPVQPASAASRPLQCLPLSARTPAALSPLSAAVAQALRAVDAPPLDQIARSLGIGRAPFEERLAVVAANHADAAARLEASARNGAPPEHCVRGTAPAGVRPEVVFLYTGQGSQYPGMGRQLYEQSSVFRAVIDHCDELLGADAHGRRLKDVLWQGEGDSAPIHETAWTQPALFAIEYALTQLWRSWGIEPAAVIGHSVGEYVAACVAGVMTLEEGLRLMAARGRLMQRLPPGGAMAAVFAPLEDVRPLVAAHAGTLAIAAINAPDSVVISGAEQSVLQVLEQLAGRNIQGHRLKVALAAHSPLVEPQLDEMQSIAGAVAPRKPQIPVAWNLGVDALPGNAAPDARYWRRHMREPVHFAQGMQWLRDQGFKVFLEVGPHPTLCALAQRADDASGRRHIGSLRRGQEEWSELSAALAQLHVAGVDPDWAAVGGKAGGRAALPNYPFERRRFWIDAPRRGEWRQLAPASVRNALRVARLPTATPLFEGVLAPDSPSWLGDHVVQGAVLVAGPVMLQMARDAFAQLGGGASLTVQAFSVHAPLVLSEQGSLVQVHLADAASDGWSFSIHSRSLGSDGAWVKHASGTFAASPRASDAAAVCSLDALRQRLTGPGSGVAHYERLEQLGIALKGHFRTLVHTWRRDGEALAEVALVEALRGQSFDAHPVLLDGALQAIGLALPMQADPSELFLFNGVEQIHLPGALGDSILVHVVMRQATGERPAEWLADLQLRSPDGRLVGEMRGVSLRRTTRESLVRVLGGNDVHPLLYHVDWEASPIIEPAVRALRPPPEWLPALRQQFTDLVGQHNVAVYDALLPQLDRLSIHHVSTALRALGFDATPGRRFVTGPERTRLGVVPAHARLFGRLLQMLGEDGVLREQDGQWEVVGALPLIVDSDAECERLMARFTGVTGELSTLRRCGPKLAQVLRGEQDPLQLLFPGGSFAEARELYVESPYARCYNGALAAALKAAIQALPSGAKLRVLEVGAGTGGTTSYTLPALPREHVEYTFTDLSGLFLDRARARFGDYPGLRTARLDIEKDPFAQGFEPAAYDVIIAANVLHATADLALTMTHVRDLLAPGGLALMLEGVAPERWVDLTFGLTDGWWRFTDPALRPDYPLINRNAWLRMLGELSFTDVATLPGDDLCGRALSQQALIVARAPQSARRWILVGGPSEVSQLLAGHLHAAGHAARLVAPADVLPADADEIVHLEALGWERPSARTVERQLERLARDAAPGATGRVWIATRGAQFVREEWSADAPMQAQLWGLGRVFSLELPERWGGLVDLPAAAPPAEQAAQLYRSLMAGYSEDQSAWRGGERYVPRLARGNRPAASPLHLDRDGLYLVSGGFGGLGLVVARWLAENGVRHVALLGRNPDMQLPGVTQIVALGVEVIPVAVDVSDANALDQALVGLRRRGLPLRGILHAAAYLDAAPLAQLTAAEFHAMNRPKVDGTEALHRLTKDDPLDFLVLFSSTTALFGAAGMAHYAAANQFMDAFARLHDQPDRRVLSVNWGTWEVMRLASIQSQRSFRDSGLNPMPADAALEALELLLARQGPDTVIADVNWEVLKPLHESRRRRPLYERMARAVASSPAHRVASANDGPAADLHKKLASASGQRQREDVLLDYVSAEVVGVLHLEGAGQISTTTGLFDLGMDSLMAVELRRRLETGTGLTLPSTLTFNYPSAAALAGFLLAEIDKAGVASTEQPTVEKIARVEPEAPAAPADLDDLTELELEQRLMQKMEKLL